MKSLGLQMTYVGGPTALLEFGGVRLLTDPTFDAFAAAKLESRLRWLEPGRATELPMEPETLTSAIGGPV